MLLNRRSLVASFVCLLSACGPQDTQEPALSITPRPRTVVQGAEIRVTVSATDGMAKAGTGSVRLTSAAGSLVDGEEQSLDGAGQAEFTFVCAEDAAGCSGTVRLTAEWVHNGATVQSGTNVTITARDAGMMLEDAGSDAGTPPADGGTDGGASSLTLRTDAGFLVAGVGDSARFTATLLLNGAPGAGETVEFSTTEGVFLLADAGLAPSYSDITAADGTAVARLSATSGASASVTVAHPASGLTATAGIPFVQVAGISFVGASCASTPTNCGLMGIAGSGFNPTAQLKFRVSDGSGRPVARVPVSFALNAQAPTGTTVEPAKITDALGEVTVNVSSGRVPGAFTVTATVDGTQFSAQSTSLGVRGAKPSNRGSIIACERNTLAAYMRTPPPLPLTMNCTVTLQDRFGNPVGTGTAVALRTEAGGLPNNVATQAYSPTSNANEGRGTFTFSTSGTWPPADVDPFPADPTQFPFPREAEPSTGTTLVQNPRDGLVSILGYVIGEEYFSDDNLNGVWDPGEQFNDQGEPFVDRNDNNVRDIGEDYFDANGNEMWDGANGQWDADTYISFETRVLYVDLPRITLSPDNFVVPRGGSQLFTVNVNDDNLNRAEFQTSFSALKTGSKGTLVTVSLVSPIADGFGFQWELRRVPATGTGNCDDINVATRPQICVYRNVFGTWYNPTYGALRLDGAAITDMTAAAATTVSVSATTRGLTRTGAVSGTVQ